MKKLLFPLIAAVCVMIVGINVTSCGNAEEKHATEILLPDSAQVGKLLPAIDGSLSEYYSIVPAPYSINLTDSILTLKVKVKVEKTYKPNKLVEVMIANPDSLLAKVPYVVLVDSLNNPVPGFCMQVDTALVSQLMTLMKGEPGVETELTFTSAEPQSVSARDSLATQAQNFNIVANLMFNVDAKAIDNLIARYKNAAADYWSFRNCGGMGYMWANTVDGCYRSAQSAKAACNAVKEYMTPEQLQRFNSVKL